VDDGGAPLVVVGLEDGEGPAPTLQCFVIVALVVAERTEAVLRHSDPALVTEV
jgi:hypothetical protein